MSKRARLAAILAAVIAVGVVVWSVSTVPAPPPKDTTETSSKMTYEGNTISEEKDGRKVWEVTAEHMEVDVKTQDATMEGVTGHFYGTDGKTTTLFADGGTYNGKTRDIKLKGNIYIMNSDGAVMTSDELEWTAQKELLAAIGNVVATNKDVFVTAARVESGGDFQKVKATGKAHIERNEEKAKALLAEQKKRERTEK